MIKGIGTDIVEVERIRQAIARYESRFLNRLFTQQEQDYCLSRPDPAIHFAGRFAAKEALVKALGTGFRGGLDWVDFEIVHGTNGKPCVNLSMKVINQFNSPHMYLSISHCKMYATATAIWEIN